MPATHPSRVRLVQLLTPGVEATGHDLEDVSVSPAGKRRVVRVVIDKDGGCTLDDVAEVSRAVSDVLDLAESDEPDLLGGAYVLEVSSPGVDRPLTLPRHWRRNTGRLVKATVSEGDVLTGRIVRADDAEVVLEVNGQMHTLLLAQLLSGNVQVEFSRPGAVLVQAEDEAHEDDADQPENLDEEDA